MIIYIIPILVIITFIYNIKQKNKVKLNLLLAIVPIVLTTFSIFYHHRQTSVERENIMYAINLISMTFALILTILAFLFVVKDRKNNKGMKVMLLPAIVMTYGFLLFLTQCKLDVEHNFAIADYYRRLYINNASIGALFLLEINLFTNLITNHQKEENHGK